MGSLLSLHLFHATYYIQRGDIPEFQPSGPTQDQDAEGRKYSRGDFYNLRQAGKQASKPTSHTVGTALRQRAVCVCRVAFLLFFPSLHSASQHNGPLCIPWVPLFSRPLADFLAEDKRGIAPLGVSVSPASLHSIYLSPQTVLIMSILLVSHTRRSQLTLSLVWAVPGSSWPSTPHGPLAREVWLEVSCHL